MELQNPVIVNEKRKRFETRIGDDYAYLEYGFYHDDIALLHTFVPEFARGKGVAERLAGFALEYVKEKKLGLMVYCAYVAKYMKRHPEYNGLLDKKYRE